MAKSKPKKFTVTDGKLVLELEVAEEGGYVVRAPFVTGLNTQGDTIEDCFEMAYDAAALLAEVARERSVQPQPTRRRKAVAS